MKICIMDGCDTRILLRPAERDVCAGCQKRGGPPPKPPKRKPKPVKADWGNTPVCMCGRPILQPEKSGDRCARCAMENRQPLQG